MTGEVVDTRDCSSCPMCRGERELQRVTDGESCRVCTKPLTVESVLSNPVFGAEGVCKWCASSFRPPQCPPSGPGTDESRFGAVMGGGAA